MNTTPRSILRTLLAASLALALACSGDEAPQAGATGRRPGTSTGPTLVQDLVIPGDPPAWPLGRIAGVAEHPGDGRMAVIEGQEREVLLFDASGDLLATVGGEGSGPGEFRFPVDPHWVSDTLWVLDPILARLTPVANGAAGKTVPVPPRAGHAHMLRDGRIAAVPLGLGFRVGMPDSQLYAITVGRPGQSAADTLFRMVQHRRGLEFVSATGLKVGPQPFDDGELIEPFPGITGLVIVDRSTERTKYYVTQVSMQGDTIFRREFDYEPFRVTDEWISWAARGLSGATPGDYEAARKALFIPPHLPPVRRLMTGNDGSIWLEMEVADPDSSDWQALSPDGAPAFRISLPRGAFLALAALDHLWTIAFDENDIPSLVRYRISPAPHQSPVTSH